MAGFRVEQQRRQQQLCGGEELQGDEDDAPAGAGRCEPVADQAEDEDRTTPEQMPNDEEENRAAVRLAEGGKGVEDHEPIMPCLRREGQYEKKVATAWRIRCAVDRKADWF